MDGKNMRQIEHQLVKLEECIANADEYVARNINVEGTSSFHFDDWRGKSGHPSWMKNWMIPTTLKARSRKEKALEKITNKSKDKQRSQRRRNVAL